MNTHSIILKYIKSDLTRYVKKITIGNFIKNYLFNPGFKFMFWFRIYSSKYGVIRAIAKLQHRRFSTKYMLDIPLSVKIGFGFYLGHGKCITINHTAIIGNNVNLSQYTTIGSNHGKAATVGNFVYIGPSVCIVEDIVVGNNVIIGAGAVVTKGIVENATVGGVPAKILSINSQPNRYIGNSYIS